MNGRSRSLCGKYKNQVSFSLALSVLLNFAFLPGPAEAAGNYSPSGTQSGSPSGTQSGSPSGTQSGSPSGTQSGSPSGTQSGSPSGTQSGLPSGTQSKGLSFEAKSMLRMLGLSESIEKISDSKQLLQQLPSSPPTLELLSARQDLLEAKQELMRRITKTNLEVDYVLSAIDGEQNRYTERIAELMAKRDRAVWRTTILSQWSNGILWCGSSSFTVASTKNPYYSYADGILGILAGAIPTVLSLYAMHQSKGNKVDSNYFPNMLAPVYDKGENSETFFPTAVFSFLSEPDANDQNSKSRRQLLKDRWIQMGYLDKPGTTAYENMIGLLTGTEARKRSLTLSILQNRQQMLDDLRSTVFQMKRVLVELVKLTD